jgi:hypothetical protein
MGFKPKRGRVCRNEPPWELELLDVRATFVEVVVAR